MKAVVTATGMDTYFGKTARLVQGAGTVSHFQRAVLRIGNFLILSTICLVALILVVALFRGDPLVRDAAVRADPDGRRDPGGACPPCFPSPWRSAPSISRG